MGGTQEHYKEVLLWEQLGGCQISREKGISLYLVKEVEFFITKAPQV